MRLFKLKNNSKFSSKGFTLIELLIVVAILGILATAVLVAINPSQKMAAAKNSTVKSDLASIGSAATLFSTDTGIGAGCAGSYPMAFGATGVGCTGTAPTFMDAINSPSGAAYVFKSIPSGTCNMGTIPCTAVSVSGPTFNDGVTTTGVWCWRSATGVITNPATAALCAP
jgi:prepilin-type N-terminal cleavage/methylation domain-containing protein